jgi:hypothetical protein
MKSLLVLFFGLFCFVTNVSFATEKVDLNASQNIEKSSYGDVKIGQQDVYSQKSISSISEVLSGTQVVSEQLAYCISIICCKTTYSGQKFCKEACGYCPMGWTQEF